MDDLKATPRWQIGDLIGGIGGSPELLMKAVEILDAERKSALLEAAAIAEAHIGSAKRERIKSKIAPMNFDAEREILAEERGEDIAAEKIAQAIRALAES